VSLQPSENPSYTPDEYYDNTNAFEGSCVDSTYENYGGIAIELVGTLEDCYGHCQEAVSTDQMLSDSHVGVQYDYNEALCGCMAEAGVNQPTEESLMNLLREIEPKSNYTWNNAHTIVEYGQMGAGAILRGNLEEGRVCVPYLVSVQVQFTPFWFSLTRT